MLALLDAHELPSPAAGIRCFEGAGLADVLGGECGIHLWYRGDDRPVPLVVQLHRELPSGGASLPGEIVRIRLEPRLAGDYRSLTDLRSGLLRKFSDPLGADDWRLLTWNGGGTPSSTS